MMLSSIKKYCTPAKIYMFIGIMHICIMLAYNIGNYHTLSVLGMKTIYVSNTVFAILAQLIWILIFGWFIDWLCRKKQTSLAWLVLLFPYLIIAGGLVAMPSILTHSLM